jgi:hypothetical protein
MWREHAHVSALAGLCSAILAGGMEGKEQQGLPLEHPGTGRRDLLLVSPVQGHLVCCSASLVDVRSGYIPMVVGETSPLRYGEGELAFSNI